MLKFLYPIYKLKTKSYIKWWLYHKKAGGSGILSEILEGFSFNLANTLNRKFNLFEIEGNSVQDGSPSPDNEVPIYSAGDNGTINEKIQNKNLLNVPNQTVGDFGLSLKVEDNNYTVSGTNTGSTLAMILNANLKLKAGTYTMATNSSNTHYPYMSLRKNGTNKISMVYADNGKKTFTLEEDTDFDSIHLYFGSASTTSLALQIEPDTTATPFVEHQEQDYSIFVQQPFRSIGDVRDLFFKNTVDSPYYDENLTLNGWYERHLPYIASYNGETLPQDVYNEVDNVKYCNEKSMSTTGQFSIGASVQYIDENNWNDLPCTETQIQQLENKPSTYKDFTIIQSQDETPAHLKIQYYKEG